MSRRFPGKILDEIHERTTGGVSILVIFVQEFLDESLKKIPGGFARETPRGILRGTIK